MQIEELDEYKKDVKKLGKKYPSLHTDIATVLKVIKLHPDARPPFSYRIEGLKLKTCVIKVKKIASDSFKGRGAQSGFRLVYALFEQEQRIVMVELYHKSQKENEDRERIKRHFD